MKLRIRYALIPTLLVFGLVVACNKKGAVDVGEDEGELLETQELIQIMPVGDEIVHPEYGKQVWFSYGAVAGIPETPANGVTYGRVFEDGTYFHTANVNIYPAENGTFYQGWLKNDAGEYVKTERLYNRLGDARHGLEFTVKRDLRDYKTVVFSLESSDSVTVPTNVVAEGVLKATEQ